MACETSHPHPVWSTFGERKKSGCRCVYAGDRCYGISGALDA